MLYYVLKVGGSGIPFLLLQLIISFLCLWPIYQMQGLGAGDCKVLLVASIFLPTKSIFSFFLTALIIGAMIGLLKYAIPNCKRKGKIHFTIPILTSAFLYILHLYP